MKILIIDDSPWQRKHLARILGAVGHDVIEASNGMDGISRFAEQPSVIVCDLLMPGIDGFGVLGALRDHATPIPIVIASADIQRTTRQKCEELGARRFVAKPYGAADILQAIAEATSEESVRC